MAQPKILLFDLGGVIVPWIGLDELARMTGLSREEVLNRFASNPIFLQYETGDCDDQTFLNEAIRVYNLDLSTAEFKTIWNDWVRPPYTDTEGVLQSLRKNYTTACLSNTNASHWAHIKTMIDPDEVFDHAFASHLIKAAKPNVNSYEITLEQLGAAPEDVWFFDDTEMNIDAARELGITAFHVDREIGVIPILKSLDLI